MKNKRRFISHTFNIVLSCFFVLLSTTFTWSKKHFDFNKNCEDAYEAIIALNFTEGKRLLEAEKSLRPQNLIPIYLENYIDCLPILFNGNPNDYQQAKSKIAERLKLMSEGDKESPWYLFTQASIRFQWAASQLRMNDLTSGGLDFRRSYLLLSENSKKHKAFSPNQALLGLEEAIIGTIPDSYRWLARILGLKGDLKNGISKVKQVAQAHQNEILGDDAVFYYSYLDFYLGKNRDEVWRFINQQNLDLKNQLLFNYMAANFAIDDNQSQKAISILNSRNQSSQYLHIHFFDFLLGVAYANNIDDRCVKLLEKFTKNYNGNIFVKTAHQKLSLFYTAKQQTSKAREERNRILQVGTAQFDSDKQAERFAKKNIAPNAFIIQARLKNDGGYIQESFNILNKIKPSTLSSEADLLEYYYRYGSVYRKLNNPKGAVLFYEKCIEIGQSSQEQFAARSALELGELYEEQKNYRLARHFYHLCLSMKNHDFQSAIDQRAKSGLARLS